MTTINLDNLKYLIQNGFGNDNEDFEKLETCKPKDVKDLKKSFNISQEYKGTFIIAVAIHNNYELNRLLEISANRGEPLNDVIHNTVTDSYHIEGYGYCDLGLIPVNYRMTISDTPWEFDIPVSFAVIKRHFNAEQRQKYEQWKSLIANKNECRFEFVQLLNCY